MSLLTEEAVAAYLDVARWEQVTEAEDKEKIAELVKGAAAGDKQAAGDLYTMYWDKIVSAVRGKSGLDPSAAEDAAQAAMMKTLMKPDYVKKFVAKPGELIRGLMRVSINQGLDAKRKQKTRGAYEIQTTDVEAGASSAKGGRLSTVKRDRVRKAVRDSLRGLQGDAKKFVTELLFDREGNLKPDTKGELATLAVKYSPSKDPKKAGDWGAQQKRRFLKKLCTNQALCAVILGTRAAKDAKFICKGVKDSCAEALEQLAGLHDLVEGSEQWLTEEVATDIVLSWLRGVVAEGR